VANGVVAGVLGLGVATLSAWLHVRGKDGSGWGFVALCLIIHSCTAAS
jgi:hypothetical protein